MSLEQDLRGALKRKEPSAGFDDRVLSKISSGTTPRIPTRTSTRTRALSWAIAASVIFASGSTYYMHNQRRSRDEHAARAARDVVLALQIASETISAAQAKVEEITRYEPKNTY
jgi:hypothetical protein